MIKSYEVRKAAKIDRYVYGLSKKSEFFGLFGIDNPKSFYRVFVRANSKSNRWWRFEESAGYVSYNPIKLQEGKSLDKTVGSVRDSFDKLINFEFKPEKSAIKKLFDRSREIGTKS